jgi:hypothetical protein
VLLCFHYNPIRGKYGALIMAIIRVLGAATLAAMAWLFGAMILRERKRSRMTRLPATSPANAGALTDTERNA